MTGGRGEAVRYKKGEEGRNLPLKGVLLRMKCCLDRGGETSDTMSQFKSEKYLEKLSELLGHNESLREETVKSLGSVVSFEVTNKKSKGSQYWVLDSKNKGELNKSERPVEDAEIQIKIADADLRRLINGKSSAQKLFMGGKLKIKGNIMKAASVEKLLKFVGPQKAKL